MKKIKVLILTGGDTSERKISLITAENVFKSLDKNKYNVSKFVLPRKFGFKDLKRIFNKDFDIIFIAIHGKLGEDGSLQGLLDALRIKYTGPGVLASSVGINKIVFKEIVSSMGYKVPRHMVFQEEVKHVLPEVFKLPYFVKPYNQGSSVGASLVDKKSELNKALSYAFKFSDKVLVEEYISGTEVSVPVLGNYKPIALPVIEIIPLKNNFFDYKSKYLQGGAEEIVPARISKPLTKKVQKIAIDIYKKLECSGFSRVDFLLKNNKSPVVLEINTIPGLTPTSLFPKSAEAYGMTYSELIDKIIKLGLSKK